MTVKKILSHYFTLPVYELDSRMYLQLLWRVAVRGTIADILEVTNPKINVFSDSEIFGIMFENLKWSRGKTKDRMILLETQGYLRRKGDNVVGGVWVLIIKDTNGKPKNWYGIKKSYHKSGLDKELVSEATKLLNQRNGV